MPINRYPKGSKEQVSNSFWVHEFDCPCHRPECDSTLIDEDLIEKLQAMRDELGVPVSVSSGNRCAGHQADLAAEGFETAKKISQHELGKAADVETGDHSGEELEVAARKAGFKAVGVGRRFAHVDTRSDKDRRWGYSRRG